MRHILSACAMAFIILATISCGDNRQQNRQQNGALQLKTESIIPTDVTIYQQYASNIEGVQNIEIRPRISGFIEQCNIFEGMEVKKGETLFTINNTIQQQQLRASKALISVAQANLDKAILNEEQVTPLVEKGILSAVELATQKSTVAIAQAQLDKAEADYENALENLSYTVIKSPVDGVVGDLPYKLGTLVSSMDPMPLTTISNIESLFVYFSLTEKELLNYNRQTQGQSTKEKLENLPKVSLSLADGSDFETQGEIVAINGLVNPRTGSVGYKARFNNPDKLIRSGSSGMVKIPNHISNALVVPQAATFEIQGKLFVYTLDKERKASSKEIKVNPVKFNDNYIVESGIKPGDIIVTEGLIKMRDGVVIM